MKEFRKNEQELFVCEECNKLFTTIVGLSTHIRIMHKNSKAYYDKWLKEKHDGFCKICNKKTIFQTIGGGYKNCCSAEHSTKWNHTKIDEAVFNKYGVKNVYQLEEIKEKKKITSLKNYGVENPHQSEEIKEKCKKTCLIKYGFESSNQNQKVFEKQQMNGFKAKKFENTNIHYRGSYELDFLEQNSSLFPDIINAKSIKYFFEEKNKIYFPDFYIPSKNLIIEIKSLYFYNLYKDKCDAKEKATIANGFNYIMILDKNYDCLAISL